ncbi:MAG TPA: cytochrome c maturation protein CcmE [Acidimicrobiia bacterium]|jgi:cytochrome c-type biogenesis protein CcmE|nr:cytochrome c maturation protein CcmE [Acidimicrobiia bacterium]
MGQRQFVLFGIAGVAALVVAITVAGLNDNLTYYLYPNEAVTQRADFPDGERFRLAGQVVVGSLSEDGDDLVFDVTDGSATIPVVLVNSPPALFDEEIPVLLEGYWSGDRFTAESALIRHSENYEVPAEGNYEEG